QPRIRTACLFLAAALGCEDEEMAQEVVATLGNALILGGKDPRIRYFDPDQAKNASRWDFPTPVRACIDWRRCSLWFGWAVKDLAVGLDRQQATALATKLADALLNPPPGGVRGVPQSWRIGLAAAAKELTGRLDREQAARLTVATATWLLLEYYFLN